MAFHPGWGGCRGSLDHGRPIHLDQGYPPGILRLGRSRVTSLQGDTMVLMQYFRLRRGVSEVVHTVNFEGDASAALDEGAELVGGGRWPARADGLRAIDQCGRTLRRWELAVDAGQPSAGLLATASKRGTAEEPILPLPLGDT